MEGKGVKKWIPIGVDDFKEVRNEGYYFVDKSELISDILSERNKVYLFTRPRRFGKSLNLSMLDAFFNLRYPKDNKWFDGLKISEHEEFLDKKNAYPVIYFDFKDLDSTDHNKFIKKLKSKLSDLYSKYGYLLNSKELDQKDVSDYNTIFDCTADDALVEYSLKNLSKMLYKHHGKKVIVLIDEYDNPINNSFGKTHQNEVIQTIRVTLSPLLKGNEYLEFAVITGVMQITKESIFSGLNNLNVNNIFSKKFDERYGFTEDEVKALCEEYGHPERFDEVKEWYDGYRFGDAEIYNPWSVLNYISKGFVPAPYWGGTSDNEIIRTLLEDAGDEIWDEIRRLADGNPIKYNPIPAITLRDIGSDKRDLYSVMAMSGYLSVEVDDAGNKWISIPNGEMCMVFGEIILRGIDSMLETNVSSFTRYLMRGDVPNMESALYDLFASSAGNAMLNDEHSYQAFITGMLMNLFGRYSVKADFEDGNGRYDIRLVPRTIGHPNVVIEIKRPNSDISDDAAENVARKALEQIKGKDYTHGLSGDTILYGVAFRNKVPTIVSERMML